MKMMRALPLIVMALSGCCGSLSVAQSGAGRLYSSATDIAAKGTVEKVANVTDGQGWYGIHLTLRSVNGTYDVRLGPSEFIAQSRFTFVPGESIEVWGSQIGTNDNLTIVARAIEKNGQTFDRLR